MSPLARVLGHRDLRLVLTGSTVSLAGDGMYSVAMAMAVLSISPTPGALAAVAVAGLLPRIAFGLLGGTLADRHSRRRILLVCDVVRAAVVAALGLLLMLGTPTLWLLVALVVPLAAASGAAAPTFSALVPDLVDQDDLVAAHSLLGSVSPLAQLVVGPVAGGLLAAYDPGVAMFVDAATFLVSAGCVLALRHVPAHPLRQGGRPLPWVHFREGLAYVRTTPWLLTNLLVGLVVTLTVSGAMTMLPLLVRETYGGGPAAFGSLLAAGGVAATVASVVVGSRPGPRHPLRASYAVYVVGLAAIAGLGMVPGLTGAAFFVAVLFAGAAVGNVLQDSVLGARVPRELRGRVSALDWVAATASGPLSVLLAAATAEVVGLRPMYIGAGVLAAVSSAVGLVLLLRSGEPVAEPSEQPALDVVQPA